MVSWRPGRNRLGRSVDRTDLTSSRSGFRPRCRGAEGPRHTAMGVPPIHQVLEVLRPPPRVTQRMILATKVVEERLSGVRPAPAENSKGRSARSGPSRDGIEQERSPGFRPCVARRVAGCGAHACRATQTPARRSSSSRQHHVPRSAPLAWLPPQASHSPQGKLPRWWDIGRSTDR